MFFKQESFVCLYAGFAGAAFRSKCFQRGSIRPYFVSSRSIRLCFVSSRFFFLSVSYSMFFQIVFSIVQNRTNLVINVSLNLSGKLQVIYPELDIDECSVIPKDLRKKISTIWEAPQIFFPEANKVRSM